MKYALNLAENGRIMSATFPEYAPTNAVIVDMLPEGDIYEYRYVNGEYIHDPLPEPEQPEEPDEPNVWDELDSAYREGVDSV